MGRSPQRAPAVPEQAPLVAVAAASAGMSVLVGLLERGRADFIAPLRAYLGDVTLVGSARSFLRSFGQARPIYSPIVRHHPPGFLLLLWLMDWAHGHGAGWAVGLVVAGGAVLVPALLVLIGRREWWIAALLIVIAALRWPAPEPAGLFFGVVAVGMALTVRGRRVAAIVGGGAVLALAMLLTYIATVPAIAVVACVALRNGRRAALALVGAAAVILVFGFAGYWWP